MADIKYPEFAQDRGLGYWLRFGNVKAARRQRLRTDHSVKWRQSFSQQDIPEAFRDMSGSRSTPLNTLLQREAADKSSFRFLILGDTGEGDKTQYATLPLIRALAPDFMIINGDIAYPAGRIGTSRNKDDYLAGFFEPYRNFGIPIWAVPGNHEYYAKHRGREFFDTYCTRKFDSRWEEYGLVHIPQPGTYWELRDPDLPGIGDLAVVGADTVQGANLDGHHARWQFWKRKEMADSEQHNWLRERLELAQSQQRKVILLYHIPALANSKYKEKYLTTLHKILSYYPCVRLVVCGHEHNHQRYQPSVFKRFLDEKIGIDERRGKDIEYVVSGGGGAYLTTTDFENDEFPCCTYPKPEQWKELAGFLRQKVELSPFSKTVFGRIVERFERKTLTDADEPRYLSMLLVEVERKLDDKGKVMAVKSKIIPVFLNDVQVLFKHLHQQDTVAIDKVQIDSAIKAAAAGCVQRKAEETIVL